MKIEIKNNHSEIINLFVKKDGIEQQVHIPVGHSIIVDAYETRTMKLFAKRGFIKVQSIEVSGDSSEYIEDLQEELEEFQPDDLQEESSDFQLDDFQDELSKLINKNNQELTESIEAVDEIPDNIKESINSESTILEKIEDEVEQYVDGGLIKGQWSQKDLVFLRRNYPTKGRKYCAIHLNRNETSVQKKITSLKLKKRKKSK